MADNFQYVNRGDSLPTGAPLWNKLIGVARDSNKASLQNAFKRGQQQKVKCTILSDLEMVDGAHPRFRVMAFGYPSALLPFEKGKLFNVGLLPHYDDPSADYTQFQVAVLQAPLKVGRIVEAVTHGYTAARIITSDYVGGLGTWEYALPHTRHTTSDDYVGDFRLVPHRTQFRVIKQPEESGGLGVIWIDSQFTEPVLCRFEQDGGNQGVWGSAPLWTYTVTNWDNDAVIAQEYSPGWRPQTACDPAYLGLCRFWSIWQPGGYPFDLIWQNENPIYSMFPGGGGSSSTSSSFSGIGSDLPSSSSSSDVPLSPG